MKLGIIHLFSEFSIGIPLKSFSVVLDNLNNWNSNFYQGTVLYSETAEVTITFGQLCYRTQNETWELAVKECLNRTPGKPTPSLIATNYELKLAA